MTPRPATSAPSQAIRSAARRSNAASRWSGTCRIYSPGLDGCGTSQIRACSSDQRCLIFGFCPSGRGFASALLSDGASRSSPLRLASPLSPPDPGRGLSRPSGQTCSAHPDPWMRGRAHRSLEIAPRFRQRPPPSSTDERRKIENDNRPVLRATITGGEHRITYPAAQRRFAPITMPWSP